MVAVVDSRDLEAIAVLEIIHARAHRGDVVVRSRCSFRSSNGNKATESLDAGDHARVRTGFSGVCGVGPSVASPLIRRYPAYLCVRMGAIVRQRNFDRRIVMSMQADRSCFFVAATDGNRERSMAFVEVAKRQFRHRILSSCGSTRANQIALSSYTTLRAWLFTGSSRVPQLAFQSVKHSMHIVNYIVAAPAPLVVIFRLRFCALRLDFVRQLEKPLSVILGIDAELLAQRLKL